MIDKARQYVVALQEHRRAGFYLIGNVHTTEIISMIESLAAELEQVKRERDAVVEMLRDKCEYCKHFHVTHNGCTPDCDCHAIECQHIDGHWTGWQCIGIKGD